MLAECSHCGAPLDVRDGARTVTCAYCDRTNRVRTMHTLAPKPPPDWEPPRQWTPPPHKHVPSTRTLEYHQPRSHGARWIVGLTVIGGLIGVAVPIVASVLPLVLGGGQVAGIVRAWDGSAPFSCGGNDSVVVENVTAVLPDDTAMTIEANCDVRIVGSTITARRGIRADGNRRVVIEKSRIQSTDTAIWADGNKRIELIDSEVTTRALAIRAGGNVEIVVSGGRVSGAPPLSFTANAGLENHGAELVDVSGKTGGRARPEKSRRQRAGDE